MHSISCWNKDWFKLEHSIVIPTLAKMPVTHPSMALQRAGSVRSRDNNLFTNKLLIGKQRSLIFWAVEFFESSRIMRSKPAALTIWTFGCYKGLSLSPRESKRANLDRAYVESVCGIVPCIFLLHISDMSKFDRVLPILTSGKNCIRDCHANITKEVGLSIKYKTPCAICARAVRKIPSLALNQSLSILCNCACKPARLVCKTWTPD